MYYRPHVDDNQYAFPLDFCPIVNTATGDVIHIDVPSVRRPVNTSPSNYLPADIAYRADIAPLDIVQPAGVSFAVAGRELSWQGFSVHIGFNYKEGIVLNDVRFQGRPLFYRLSLAGSGFQAKGINPFFTNNAGEATLRNVDSNGYLVQGA